MRRQRLCFPAIGLSNKGSLGVRPHCRLWAVLAAMIAGTMCRSAAAQDFSREIQPILSNHCYKCHGPDSKERQAGLRLDEREAALKPAESGEPAIVPGKPEHSELIRRIEFTDPEHRMPPEDGGKPLTAAQIDLLKRWIKGGADYARHWSYVKPTKPQVPAGQAAQPIDRFLEAKYVEQKLTPGQVADRRTLLRRLSFDLVGLPPMPAELDAFVNDKSDNAVAQVVERLLASPHYGERMALMWLDLIRYGDTGGYHSDNHRDVWMFRDYVINAFNQNKPFDQFTKEQLAGDLLPNRTPEQWVASGYNRMLMTTEEGGAQPKEYTAKYGADRVRNIAAAWLGLTLVCCECHDHKYDPYTMKDFYGLAAFFADVQEKAVGRQDQTPITTTENAAKLAEFEAAVTSAQKALDEATAKLETKLPDWEESLKSPEFKGEKPPQAIADILALEPKKRNAKQKKSLLDHFHAQVPELKPLRDALAKAVAEKANFSKNIPTTLVSMSGPPRTVRILPRGNWLDESGEPILPSTPAYITVSAVKSKEDKRLTRLDLTNWLVAADNPLTARVFVNRVWKLMFGYGLVRTPEDFGMQGERPTHPELLDWLAVDFCEHGWDVKRLVKQIVLTKAYQRTSVPTAEHKKIDPLNLYLARQNRFRLDAELVRDNALAISGLMVDKLGGPSVKPYQPAGYWAYLNFPTRDWVADKGENQYRRGLYTYWQRTFPHPMMLAFDAPSREECVADRPRANIPQQALVLLNDPTFVEAARVLAEKTLAPAGKSNDERVAWLFTKAVGRAPQPEEASVLLKLLDKHEQAYASEPAGADKILAVGDMPVGKDVNRLQLAAWTSVARAVLNLHETVTRN